MNEYVKQAKDFLKSCNATMKITQIGYEANKNWNENVYRNTYRATIKTPLGTMWVKFWDSVYNTEKGIEGTQQQSCAHHCRRIFYIQGKGIFLVNIKYGKCNNNNNHNCLNCLCNAVACRIQQQRKQGVTAKSAHNGAYGNAQYNLFVHPGFGYPVPDDGANAHCQHGAGADEVDHINGGKAHTVQHRLDDYATAEADNGADGTGYQYGYCSDNSYHDHSPLHTKVLFYYTFYRCQKQ